jgi:hypothetical protein
MCYLALFPQVRLLFALSVVVSLTVFRFMKFSAAATPQAQHMRRNNSQHRKMCDIAVC